MVGQIDSSCDDLLVPSTMVWMVGKAQFLVKWDQQDCIWDGKGLHIAEDVSSWMMSTLLPTDVFLLVNERCSLISTIEKSVTVVVPSSRNKSERNVILWRGWLVACWLWSLQFVVVDFHLRTANQSVIIISYGEVPLEGLALPPYTIQSLTMEHGSLKNGWCGRKSVSSPLRNSLDVCDPVYVPSCCWVVLELKCCCIGVALIWWRIAPLLLRSGSGGCPWMCNQQSAWPSLLNVCHSWCLWKI